jgi:hypothetical protein
MMQRNCGAGNAAIRFFSLSTGAENRDGSELQGARADMAKGWLER